jgi:hypothetical protein
MERRRHADRLAEAHDGAVDRIVLEPAAIERISRWLTESALSEAANRSPTLALFSNEGLAMRPLSRVARTLGVNLRSMGRSTTASDHGLLSMEQGVRDLEAVRRKLGIAVE